MSHKEKERLQWEFRKLFPGYSALLDLARDVEMFQNQKDDYKWKGEQF